MESSAFNPADLQTTFIDWLDIRQDFRETHTKSGALVGGLVHDRPFEELPLVYGAIRARGTEIVADTSEDGKVYYLIAGDKDDRKGVGYCHTARQHEGSHSTKLLIECDGARARVSGNIGRLDRLDNIWNYNLEDTVLKGSEVMRSYGLPAFSRGVEYMRPTLSAHDHERGVSPWVWSGAYFAEMHVTRNFQTGGEKQAVDFMRSMSAFRSSRISKGRFGDETLNFGMPTKKGQRLRKAVVVYRKAAEMLAHAKGDDERERIKKSPEYQFAQDVGLVRIECKWGRDFLRDKNLRYWGAADMAKIIRLFNEETTFLLTADPGRVNRVVADMPNKVRAAALLWIQGHDLRTLYPRSTYFRHVKALRDYGIDAAEPRDVNGRPDAEQALERMLDQTKTFDLLALPAPEWYGLPEIERRAA